MKTSTNKYYLSFLLVLCFAFACYNYYNKIINPFSKDILKCEGMVLNEDLKYHVTDKNTHKDLRLIRGNDIEISNNDILLHYRTQDMEKISPSYWGSFYYNNTNGEWNFKLDKSFSNNPKSNKNVHLPFLRKLQDDNFFFSKSESVSESQLKEKLFINNVGGSKASRYYIEIKVINGKKTLPFYDEGIKRSYSLKNIEDKILIAFNSNHVENFDKYFYSFKFENTSNHSGNFELTYNPNENLKIKNITTGELRQVKQDVFEVGDMMFSISPRYTTFDTLLLSLYLLITFSSVIIFLFNLRSNISFLQTCVLNIRVIILLFLLLGFPVLATAFDTQNFSWLRKIILAMIVPSVPFLSSYIFHKVKYSKFLSKILLNTQLYGKKVLENKLGLIVFLTLGITFLYSTRNERVLGVFPVLHYVKLIIFALFFILYSNAFASILKKTVIKLPLKYHTYIKSVIIITFSLICSVITKDYGSLILIIFTCLLFEYCLGNFPIKVGRKKLNFPKIILYYVVISFFIFCLGYLIDMPDKAYRLTYTFSNPDSSAYQNVNDSNRETISILYQNLKLLLEYPFGIQNLIIPRSSLSVSHTDYALHWMVMNNGIPFLVILSLVLFTFANNIFKLIFVLSREIEINKQGITTASKRLTIFTTFILIFTFLQCLVPLASNLLLPGAFLTGIPFPGISISIGDAVFFMLLFLLFDFLTNHENRLPEHYKTAFSKEANQFSKQASVSIALLFLILIISKLVLINLQSSSTNFKTSKNLIDRIENLPSTNNRDDFLKFSFDYFKDKNLSRLSKKDKLIAKMISCKYYSTNNVKLNKDKFEFSISSKNIELKIVGDSLLNSRKKIISGNKWLDSSVYVYSHFVNGKKEYSTSSKYYSNIDFFNDHLNRDVTALVNKKLEWHINNELKNYDNLKASVLIVENSTGHTVVNAAYPFDIDNPNQELNFFPGSIKKIILAHYYSVIDNRGLKSNIFKSRKAPTPIEWIAKSDNEASYEYWSIINIGEFKSFLGNYYNDFSYVSNAMENGYSENNKKAPNNTIIGGQIKYSPNQINSWLMTCSKDAFQDNNILYNLLNSPLTHKNGTARQVALALKEYKLDPSNYIAKTGTLEEKGKNIATSFAISNRDYTVTILIDGVQPSNRKKVAAKHLFVELIPIVNEFLQEQ